MKISTLRKIYPYISDSKKNIKWRKLTTEELSASLTEPQVIPNCYDEATRDALQSSKKGFQYLKNRIRIQKNVTSDHAYKFNLNVNGQNETFRTTKQDYFGKYFSLFREYNKDWQLGKVMDKPRLSFGLNIVISKLIAKHPKQKPFLCRAYLFPLIKNRNFEHNLLSNAFKWYTGISPTQIGEDTFNKTLRQNKEEVLDLLKNIGQKKSEDYSFVAVSGPIKLQDGHKWHCYPIKKVDNENKTITVQEKRSLTSITFTFDEFINKIKAIVGIDWTKSL